MTPEPGFPDPVVRSREATDADMPDTVTATGRPRTHPAKALAELARAHGWQVRVTYARGYVMGSGGSVVYETRDVPVVNADGTPVLTPTGKPKVERVPTQPRLADSIAVRMEQPRPRGSSTTPTRRQRAVATWTDGKLDTALVDGIGRVGVTRLRDILKGNG